MENTETIMAEVVGICSSCENFFMCESYERDIITEEEEIEEDVSTIRMVCLILGEEIDVRIKFCTHFIDREDETPTFFSRDPYK